MTAPTVLPEPDRVDEPQAAQEYAAVFSRVASEHRPLIVRRDGADLAAVVPLELLELVREVLARQEAESLAGQIDWARVRRACPPSPQWLEGDEPKPF